MAKDPADRFPSAGALAAAAREALLAEASTSAMTEPPVQALTEIPDPTWQAASPGAAMQRLAEPVGPEAEPAGDSFAHGVPGSQTQTIDWGGTPADLRAKMEHIRTFAAGLSQAEVALRLGTRQILDLEKEETSTARCVVDRPEAEFRHQLAHFLRDEVEKILDELGTAGEFLPQLRVLRR